MLTPLKRKCLRCGYVYARFTGGFINKPSVFTCPRCGSRHSIPWFSR